MNDDPNINSSSEKNELKEIENTSYYWDNYDTDMEVDKTLGDEGQTRLNIDDDYHNEEEIITDPFEHNYAKKGGSLENVSFESQNKNLEDINSTLQNLSEELQVFDSELKNPLPVLSNSPQQKYQENIMGDASLSNSRLKRKRKNNENDFSDDITPFQEESTEVQISSTTVPLLLEGANKSFILKDPLLSLEIKKPKLDQNEKLVVTPVRKIKTDIMSEDTKASFYYRYRDQISQQQRINDYVDIYLKKMPVSVNTVNSKMYHTKFIDGLPHYNDAEKRNLKEKTAKLMLQNQTFKLSTNLETEKIDDNVLKQSLLGDNQISETSKENNILPKDT